MADSLLFGKNDGSTNRRRVADRDITLRSINNTVAKLGIPNTHAKTRLRKMMMRDQKGGLTRDEVHTELQNLVKDGYLSVNDARSAAKKLGLKNKSHLRFLDISQYNRRYGGSNKEESTKEKHYKSPSERNKERMQQEKRNVVGNSERRQRRTAIGASPYKSIRDRARKRHATYGRSYRYEGGDDTKDVRASNVYELMYRKSRKDIQDRTKDDTKRGSGNVNDKRRPPQFRGTISSGTL
jgi:hypothetical protein